MDSCKWFVEVQQRTALPSLPIQLHVAQDTRVGYCHPTDLQHEPTCFGTFSGFKIPASDPPPNQSDQLNQQGVACLIHLLPGDGFQLQRDK